MIGTSFHELVFIRICIFLLQYSPLICAATLGISLFSASTSSHPQHGLSILNACLAGLLGVEALFYLLLYRRHKARLSRQAIHPQPLDRDERRAAFARCEANVPDGERYLRWWFLGADLADVRRDNVRSFLLWAFFCRGDEESTAIRQGGANGAFGDGNGGGGERSEIVRAVGVDEEEVDAEVDEYVDRCEALLGRHLPPGRGKAKALRLTFEKAETRYRTFVWYIIVGVVDSITHFILLRAGYRYFATPLQTSLAVFPPRVQAVTHRLLGHKSASSHLGYWLRPHTARGKLPVVFLHGIGIGLWPYTQFLAELAASNGDSDEGQVGVLVIELLPISMRLTAPPLRQDDFVRELHNILHTHGWDATGFVLVSHSYGSVLTTHVLHSAALGPLVRAVVLIDPVSICLHLPDVAYNFTRRPPRRANEWQLWYFASMDLGVAEALGRHFFWQENVVWKDELFGLNVGERKQKQKHMQADERDDDMHGSGDGAGIGGSGAANGWAGRPAALLDAGRSSDSDTGHAAAGDRRRSPRQRLGNAAGRKRKVAVSLAGRDLIVDTFTVAKYLVSTGDLRDWDDEDEDEFHLALGAGMLSDDERSCSQRRTRAGIEMLWYPNLDHAQVFDTKENRARLLDIISKFSADIE